MDVELVDLSKYDLSRSILTKEQVYRILPHTHEFQLLDGVLAMDLPNRVVVGFYQTRKDEFWVKGHFPGNPVLPGVFMIEAAAHIAIITYKHCVPEVMPKLIGFAGGDGMRFRGIIRPGDRVVIACRLKMSNPRGCKALCWGYVKDQLMFDCDIFGVPVQQVGAVGQGETGVARSQRPH
jgi:3-hydroxyacyl-[acyl-carrier-protein] dehydratase